MISNLVEKKLKEQFERKDYYAPEFKQLSGMGDISRSDIWSFGMIYYFCLTGELPQFDESQKAIITSLKTSNGNKTVIRKCLEMDPANRMKLAKISIEDYDKEVLQLLLDESKHKNTTEEEYEDYIAQKAAEEDEDG
jgi:serine/threonine protein kinase